MENPAQGGESTSKKGPFDALDRDELIKKCKGLLAIAKNAKQAKDECSEEIVKLKEIIKNNETQKSADKEGLRAMQEIVQSLTEQKLSQVNRITDLEKSLSLANRQLNENIDTLKLHSEQQIENESMQRQIKRLTEENEELISDLQQLEQQSEQANELIIKQKQELALLEEITEKHNQSNSLLDSTMGLLKAEVEKSNDLHLKCTELQSELEALKVSKDSKDFDATQLNELENENKSLKSAQQADISRLNELNLKYTDLLTETKLLDDVQEKLKDLQNENDSLKSDSEQLLLKFKALESSNEQLNAIQQSDCEKYEHLTDRYNCLENENLLLQTDSNELKLKCNDLQNDLKSIQDKYSLQLDDLNAKNVELTNENTQLKSTQQILSTQLNDSQSKHKYIENDNLKLTADRETDKEKLLIELECIRTELAEQRKSADNQQQENEDEKKRHLEIHIELTASKEQLQLLQIQTEGKMKKLKLYKTKLVEFAGKLKQLKNCKEILSTTVAEYSQAVTKWQLEIVKVSNELFEKIRSTKLQNKELLAKIILLEANSATTCDHQREIDILKSDLENKIHDLELHKEFHTKYNELVKEHDAMLTKLSEKNETIGRLQDQDVDKIAMLEKCNNTLAQELANVKSDFEKLDETFTSLQDHLVRVEQEKFLNLQELHSVRQQLDSCADKDTELNDLLTKLSKNQSEIGQLNEALAIKVTEANELSNLLAEIKEQLSVKQSELDSINCKLLENSNKKEAPNKQISDLQMEIMTKNNELLESIRENEILKKENALKAEKCNENTEQALQKQLDSFTEKFENQSTQLNSLTETNSILLNDFATKSKQMEQLEIELLNRSAELNANSTELESVKQAIVLKDGQLKTTVNELEQFKKHKSSEIEELLVEMREINEAFKNRGDVISKQKDKISQLDAEVDNQLRRCSEMEKLTKKQSAESEQLAEKIRELEKTVADYHGNDQLSTSTISRVEEIARMRDVEDSFEEKYNKLRLLAIKLKKKVTEQTETIGKLEAKNHQNIDESKQITNKLGAIDVQVKNLQLLQSENDKLQDQLEAMRDEKKVLQTVCDQLKEDSGKLATELEQLKHSSIDAKSSAATSDKTKASLDQAIKEYVKQIQNLKEENSGGAIVRKDLENELVKLRDALNERDKQIAERKDEEKKILAELTKARSSVKKTNVLNLEMDAYEKSLNDVSQKLELKNVQVNELNTTIQNQEISINTLKNQIKLLEESLESEKLHSIDLKQQIDIQQTKLKEREHDKSELKQKMDELQREKNVLTLELEDVRLDAAKNMSEKENVVRVLQNENEKNIRQLVLVEEELATIKQKYREVEQQLIDVNTEFASYKVRAQSVLRQNQTKESSREKDLEEELNATQSANVNLTAKLTSVVEQNKQFAVSLEEVGLDKERLQSRCKELLALLDEIRSQLESVQEESRRQNVDHQEALKAQRLQIETLNNCYKKQMADMEEKNSKEIDELKSSVLSSAQKHQQIADNRTAMADNMKSFRHKTAPLASDEQKIDWILTERQEGEGSENTNYLQRKVSTTSSSGGGKKRRDLMPLDELLNSSFDDNDFLSDTADNMHVGSPTIELQQTKEKLNVQQTRVKHLTSLLAEAEQDLARLTQLNDVLKEEVRRQERSTEREQHLHNLEYLKNVVFKFLTINSGDEKAHLVPVLNTILKLSPDETNKLQIVAKGGAADGGPRGWGSYIPGWTNNNNQ